MGWRLTEHQTQRHGQAVVNVHFVDDGQVKVLLNHRLCNMRSQLRMALHHRHRARAPAFISWMVRRGGANGKSGNHVQTERCGVVVEHQKNHVGSVVLHPLFRVFVALEQWLPIGLFGFTQVKRRANSGDV